MVLLSDVNRVPQVYEVFEMHLEEGLHHGAQLAVYKDGEEVIDHAGGVTGPDGDPTTTTTPHLLFSCAKPYAAVCIHQLAEDGSLAYDDPVREHWPDFADPDTEKGAITIRHVLSHQAGIPSHELDGRPDDWGDWGTVVEAMEDVEVEFTPGSTAAYHPINYGWIVGELVRRLTGTPIEEYVAENVFDPLGMDETHLGKPSDLDIATLVGFQEFERCRTPESGLKGFTQEQAARIFNRDDVQEAVMPSSTAVGTARDMARFFACLASGGELDGTRILEERTVEQATTLHVEVDADGTLGVPRRYALGFERGGLPYDKYGVLSQTHVFGHGGLGSSVAWADPAENLSMAYVTNGIREENENRFRAQIMAEAVRAAFTDDGPTPR